MKENTVMEIAQQYNLESTRKRILFASFPADGHFNPLTGLAKHLQSLGHDVRWYTSPIYADKLSKLRIRHYSFTKALDINGENANEVFPERKKIKRIMKKLSFDMINGFILRSVEYFEDIKDIHQKFPFELMICDCMFTGAPFVKEKMNVPVISIGVLPLIETSKDLAPVGLGLPPAASFLGRRKQDLLRFATDKILFRKANQLMKFLLKKEGIKMEGINFFDMLAGKATLLLQSGTPGFEYKRSDLNKNVRFIGALFPYKTGVSDYSWHSEKFGQYNKIILVTQGTVEKDVSKLLEPALEAFKNSDYLVVATTGGSGTKELQKKYQHDNIIIEDFIPFSDVMPYANVYITNGGYGGVMLGIQNKLPMVVAGIHEGKKEISARAGYFKIGISLSTERPTAKQIKASVEKIFSDKIYATNVRALAHEFSEYEPHELCTYYINRVLHHHAQKNVVANVAF